MARMLTVMVVGLMAAGTLVALLPAQEAMSRRRSRYNTADAPPVTLPPATLPGDNASELLPTDSSPSLSQLLKSAAKPAAGESATGIAPPADAEAESPAEEGTEASPSDEEAELAGTRSILKRPRPSLVGEAAPPRFESAPSASSPSTATPPSSASGISARRVPGGNAPVASVRGVALAAQSPTLRVDIAGPPSVVAGKAADYLVTLSNLGDTVAEEVQVRLALPTWVHVSGSETSSGEAAPPADGDGASHLVWTVPSLAGKAREQLRLQLLTTEGDAFDLAVDWTCRPATARATITVKRPQIEVALTGPGEMTFGETTSFTLSVSNPGTGDAEQVVVNLSTGDGRTQPIQVGNVPAGHKKELPLEVVASQAGEMELHAKATGDGGLVAQTTGKVLVRKAELNVALEGPPLKYAGTEALYLVTVANRGNAPAEQVGLALKLPAGAKYLGGIEGAAMAAGNLRWKVASLPAGSEKQYELRVQLQTAGINRLLVQASAATAGTASTETETTVEAISDLKLIVNDPAGPVPTGGDAVYEVQVVNRGTQAAEQVKIVVQFSEGIEPLAFEGCQAKIVPGQVLCQPLASLGAGEQITLRIKAKAAGAGTHQFRVEVTGADADTRLVSEGTTRFFSETGRASTAARTAQKPSPLPMPSGPGTHQR